MLIKRVTSSGANDLNTTYRPCTVDEVIGHDINKKVIKSGLTDGTLSHTLLFTGPAGCGKTTTARIIALGLNCEKAEKSTDSPCLECTSCRTILEQKNLDVVEVNVGKDGGKAAVTKIAESLGYAPMHCRHKVLIFDEAHKLTEAAQNLLLKIVEDGYKHVYFIFCTNKPEKLEEAFFSRVTVMNFGRMPNPLLHEMLKNICDFEGIVYKDEALTILTEAAKGVPRDAIILLKQVIDEGSWDIENIKYIVSNNAVDEDNPNIIEICKTLQSGSFKGALKVLKKLKNVPEEQVRMAVAGFFTRQLEWSKSFDHADKVSAVLDVITVPIYFTGKPARHVLVNYFYKTVRILKKE